MFLKIFLGSHCCASFCALLINKRFFDAQYVNVYCTFAVSIQALTTSTLVDFCIETSSSDINFFVILKHSTFEIFLFD